MFNFECSTFRTKKIKQKALSAYCVMPNFREHLISVQIHEPAKNNCQSAEMNENLAS